MDTIRIGFVGFGGICRQRHAPGLAKIDGVELTAVVNRTRESSEAAAREWRIPHVCDTWQELVARDDIDAVVIGTWPYLHCPVSVAALESGKHVFCQARMAMDYAEAKRMHAAAEASGCVAVLCPVPIGLSIDRTIARLLREGTLGRVYLVRVQGLSDAFMSPEAPMTWRKDHRLSGLNALTLGMYIEVIHRWFGWTREVSAQTRIFTPKRRDAAGATVSVQIPDQILFNTRMESGPDVQYVISGVARHGTDAIEFYGEHETLLYDVARDALSRVAKDGSREPIAIRPQDAYDLDNWRVERDFIAAIREGAPYHPDFEDGLRYMQVVQSVYESAAAKKTVVFEND